MANATKDSDFDAGFSRPVSNIWKPGKPGDKFKGTYLGFKTKENKFNPGAESRVHSFRGIAGEFHNIVSDEASGTEVVDEASTPVKAGEDYVVFGRSMVDQELEKARPGQQVVLRYLDLRKPKKGGKPYKFIETKLGGMDEDWLKENAAAPAKPEEVDF